MALVLTRRRGQSLCFNLPDGRLVRVKLDQVGDCRVQLRIDAPEDVRVLRDEVQARDEREGRK